jgi:citronellol/citronellal dehydrogenase
MPGTLAGRTLFITGASRGIGLAIALRAAREGANVAIAAKTVEPHPRLPGTIHTAAQEIEKAGGRALPLACDIRNEAALAEAIERTAAHFGGVDILVNNASAIHYASLEKTDVKRLDLMWQVNARGTLVATKFAIPHLARSDNAHVLMLSPPLELREKWLAPATPYAIAKYGMSLAVLGLSGELRPKGIAVNALWPRTTIATSAIRNLLGGEAVMRASRRPEILADAAYRVFLKDARSFSGNFLIDDTFLAAEGVTDFDRYRVDPGVALQPDFFVPEDSEPPAPLAAVENRKGI